MRVTWALLSLGLLFHCTDGEEDSNRAPTTVPNPITSKEIPTPKMSESTSPSAAPKDSPTTTQPVTTKPATSIPASTTKANTVLIGTTAEVTTSPVTKASNPAPDAGTSPSAAPKDSPTSTQPVATEPATSVPASTTKANTVPTGMTSAAPTSGKPAPDAANPAPVATIAPGQPGSTSGSVMSNTVKADPGSTQKPGPSNPPIPSGSSAQSSQSPSGAPTTMAKPTYSGSTKQPTYSGPTQSGTPPPSQNPSTSSHVGSNISTATNVINTMGGTLTSNLATTTTTTTTTTPTTPTTTTTTATTTVAAPKTFEFVLSQNNEQDHERKDLIALCRRLIADMQDAKCTLRVKEHGNGKTEFDSVEVNGKVKPSLAAQYYEEITREPKDNTTLIAILASIGVLAMIVGFAIYASFHRRSYRKNQQHLTEELHTVENGYHDNPTLEVMEVQPEMQEKKTALHGEFNDSWIVPIDNLLKEDIADEEDTHL